MNDVRAFLAALAIVCGLWIIGGSLAAWVTR
jgi:ABC-type uncharacterized transport system permease subunit